MNTDKKRDRHGFCLPKEMILHKIKIMIFIFLFSSSIFSQEVTEESKTKSKNYFNSILLLSYSLYYFSEANGYRNNAINLQNTRSDFYALGAMVYQNQSQRNQEISILYTWSFIDMKTTTIEHYNNAYQSSLNYGFFLGVLLGVISSYLDGTRIDKSKDILTQSMIIPFLNWNSRSAEIGISFRF